MEVQSVSITSWYKRTGLCLWLRETSKLQQNWWIQNKLSLITWPCHLGKHLSMPSKKDKIKSKKGWLCTLCSDTPCSCKNKASAITNGSCHADLNTAYWRLRLLPATLYCIIKAEVEFLAQVQLLQRTTGKNLKTPATLVLFYTQLNCHTNMFLLEADKGHKLKHIFLYMTHVARVWPLHTGSQKWCSKL